MNTTYRARPRTAAAIQFTGANTADVEAFLGGTAAVLGNPDGTISVYANGREGRRLLPSWWVSIDDGNVTTHSAQAFERFWEPVSTPPAA